MPETEEIFYVFQGTMNIEAEVPMLYRLEHVGSSGSREHVYHVYRVVLIEDCP